MTLPVKTVIRGNPVSADHEIDPTELVTLLEEIQTNSLATNSAAYYEDLLTDLQAISSPSDGDIGFVTNDPTSANNGAYRYASATWIKTSELPIGATSSAVLARKWANEAEDTVVEDSEFSAKHYSAKSSASATAAASSAAAAASSESAAAIDAATVASDRAAVNALASVLPADSVVATFADLPVSPSSGDIALILADENAGGIATLRRYDGADWDHVVYVSRPMFATVPIMLAAPGSFAENDLITVSGDDGNFLYTVAASSASDDDLQMANGTKLYAVPSSAGMSLRSFAPVADNSTDDASKVNDLFAATGYGTCVFDENTAVAVNSGLTMPPEIKFKGQGGSNYANPSRANGSKIANTSVIAGAVVSITGTTLQSLGGNTDRLWITSAGAGASTDLTGVNLYGIEATNLFNHIFHELVVEHFNGAWAFWSSGQCNKLVFVRPRILIGGHRVAVGASSSTQAYGGGLYLVAAPDSNVEDPFIEAVDGNGIYLGGNSKIRGGFIDLCMRGVLCANGENSSISDTSLKFHTKNAIYLFDSPDFSIRNVKAKSGNTAGAIINSNDASTIRLASNVDRLTIEGCDFVHNQQWRGPNTPAVISLGASGNSAKMSNCVLGDVRVNDTHIVDGNGVWPEGGFEFCDNALQLGSARAELDAAVAYTSGLIVESEKYTTTYSGATYVKKNNSSTAPLPYTTPVSFEPDEWVELEERDKRGLVVPNDVTDDFGTLHVTVHDGATDDWALTLGQRCNIQGRVKTKGVTKLVQGGGGTIAPAFLCDAKPTTIGSVTSTNGALKIRGLSWPINAAHTGGSTNEDFALADLPASFRGRVSAIGRQTSGLHLSVTADVDWDGSTLTVSNVDSNATGGAFSIPTFVASGGVLHLRFSSSSATNFTVNFEFSGGHWTIE